MRSSKLTTTTLVSTLLGGLAATAEAPAPPKISQDTNKGGATETSSPLASALLDVTLHASQSVLGDPRQGVQATLRNTGKAPLVIPRKKFVFVLFPGSTRENAMARGCGDFPTIREKDFDLILQPNESYTVLWNLASNDCEKPSLSGFPTNAFSSMGLGIHSGLYRVVLNTQFTIMGDKTERNVTRTIDTRIAISAQGVLLWAILGGAFGYWAKRFAGNQNKDSLLVNMRAFLAWQSLFPFLGYGLMSGVLTLLATQLSETVFPVKVDTSSWIGALSAGFMMFFAAQRIILGLTK